MPTYKFSRYAMYVSIEKFFKDEERTGICLFIGEGKKSVIRDMFPLETEKVITDYPEVDIHDLPFDDYSFDYVVADQVLEHVRKPWKGVEEVRRVLFYNGWAILTSCLVMHRHTDMDFWRFTPDGLAVLCENFKNIYQCAGSGSFEFVKACESKIKYTPVSPGDKLESLAIEDDGKYWRNVWIIAQK